MMEGEGGRRRVKEAKEGDEIQRRDESKQQT